jgi:hypothetical protein
MLQSFSLQSVKRENCQKGVGGGRLHVKDSKRWRQMNKGGGFGWKEGKPGQLCFVKASSKTCLAVCLTEFNLQN